MATKLLTINSIINLNQRAEDDACSLCARSGDHRFGVQYDYASGRIIDWRGDDDFSNHGEALVCSRCEEKFDPDVLLEV